MGSDDKTCANKLATQGTPQDGRLLLNVADGQRELPLTANKSERWILILAELDLNRRCARVFKEMYPMMGVLVVRRQA